MDLKNISFIYTIMICLVTGSVVNANEFISAEVIHGLAKVVDGDGVEVNGIEIRIQGIAAPEHRINEKSIGYKSTQNLRGLVGGKYLICHLDGTKTGNRPVGVCFFNLLDIGQFQIETGHARDCEAYSNGRYHNFELRAKASGFDLSTSYELPNYCFYALSMLF